MTYCVDKSFISEKRNLVKSSQSKDELFSGSVRCVLPDRVLSAYTRVHMRRAQRLIQ